MPLPVLLSLLLAAPAPEAPISLSEALALADRQNPDLLAALARIDGGAARVESIRRMSWPRLSAGSTFTRSNAGATAFGQKIAAGEFSQADFAIDRLNSPDGISHLSTSVTVESPVDVFGKVAAQAETQAAAVREARASVEEARAELRLRVAEAYRQAAFARRAVDVTRRALEAARAREADVEARVSEGAALTADLLRARARRREREADLAERRGDAEAALAALARALGSVEGASPVPSEPVEAPAPLPGDEASWTRQALAARPALAAARARQESASWAATSEERSLLPDLGVFATLQDDHNLGAGGRISGTVGAGIRWNAFDPARSRRAAAARAEQRSAELAARATADQVRLEVALAWRRAVAARERHAAAAGGAEEGREALRVLQERRQAGLATLTDELETETASLAAELSEIRAATEAALADAALRRAAGESPAAAPEEK